MEHKIKVHLEGFFDPLEGILKREMDGSTLAPLETLFGTERKGVVYAEGTTLVVNHEEQYSREGEKGFEDPIFGYVVSFEDPFVGKKLEELYREKREVLVSVSKDGSEMKIG